MCFKSIISIHRRGGKKKKKILIKIKRIMDEKRREKKKKKKEKSAIGYAISSRIGIYRDRGWPPPSYTRVERVVGREFS